MRAASRTIGLTRPEKLVILDFLIRNTDRGLDNLMIRVSDDRTHVRVVAIDNSLAFPHEHPRGYRDYPWGWLWLRAASVDATVLMRQRHRSSGSHLVRRLDSASCRCSHHPNGALPEPCMRLRFASTRLADMRFV